MEIIKKSAEFSKKDQYKMTLSPAIKKMKDIIGTVFDVKAYCVYNDENSTGEEVEVLSIMTADGEVFATNSPTFKRDFDKIVELMDGEDITIEVISGTSKAGRDFITCTIV